MKARRLLTTLLAVMVVFGLTACTTLVRTRSVFQEFGQPEARKATSLKRDTFDAISAALMNNGFEIAMANERLGIVNTAYRDVTSGADTAANVVGIFAAAMSRRGTYTSYSRALSLSFQVTDAGYRVVPKVSLNAKTTNVFKSDSSSNVEYPTQDSHEGRMVAKILSEINQTLGLQDAYVWEEKVVKVDGN